MEQHFSARICRNFIAVSYNSGLADSWLVHVLGTKVLKTQSFMIAAWNQFFPPCFELICLFTLHYHKWWPTTFNKCILNYIALGNDYLFTESFTCVLSIQKGKGKKERKKDHLIRDFPPSNTDKLVKIQSRVVSVNCYWIFLDD